MNGGVNIQSARVDVVWVDADHQLSSELGCVFAVHSVTTRRGALRGLDDNGLSECCFVFGVGQVAQRMHASEHIALTQDGARLVGDRVKARRRLGDAS